jgi:hypothetical protein
MLGAGTVAALAVCLAGAWAWPRTSVGGTASTASPAGPSVSTAPQSPPPSPNATVLLLTPTSSTSVDVEVLNDCLLPVLLGILLILERCALLTVCQMHGIRLFTTSSLTNVVITLGFYTGFQALTGHV